MLYHISLSAYDPRRVAQVLAELLGGTAYPFPPLTDNGWVALAGDDSGTAIEVLPFGTLIRENNDGTDIVGVPGGGDVLTATHAAIGVDLDLAAIMRIAEREGWTAKERRRGRDFGAIELWIEGRQMLELLTPAMQRQYLHWFDPDAWELGST